MQEIEGVRPASGGASDQLLLYFFFITLRHIYNLDGEKKLAIIPLL